MLYSLIIFMGISLLYWTVKWTPLFWAMYKSYVNETELEITRSKFFTVDICEIDDRITIGLQMLGTFCMALAAGLSAGLVLYKLWPLIFLVGIGYLALRLIRYSKRLKKSLKPLIDTAHTHDGDRIVKTEIQEPEL